MLTGEIRSQIDSIWNDFWSGGVANPLSVIEQITYLLFIKRLDELQTVEEKKASMLGIPLERKIFPKGKDERGRRYADLRWSRFKQRDPREMFTIVDEHVLPRYISQQLRRQLHARHYRWEDPCRGRSASHPSAA